MVPVVLFLLSVISARGLLAQTPSGEWVECSPDYPNCYTCSISETNLIVNGDFEAEQISDTVTHLRSINGWDLIGDEVEIKRADYTHSNGCTIDRGSQFVQLDSAEGTDGVIQVVNTIPGFEYELSFLQAKMFEGGNTVEVQINDEPPLTFTTESCVWVPFIRNFTAKKQTRVQFRGTSNNVFGPDIDNVKLSPKGQYLVTYFFIPTNTNECKLCHIPSTSAQNCDDYSSTEATAHCYGYVSNSQVITTYCWKSTSRFPR